MTTETKTTQSIQFTNWSTKIFMGFYESILYNSDTLYNMNDNESDEIPKGMEYDIKDFGAFQIDVSKDITEILENRCIKSIIQLIEFVSLDSPKYYNYGTDKITCNVKYNFRQLYMFCFSTAKNDFNEYLKDNFTSYDGFHSFVSNNIEDFKKDMHDKSEIERCINVMIEYFMLVCIMDCNEYTIDVEQLETSLKDFKNDSYVESCYEKAFNALYSYAELVAKD